MASTTISTVPAPETLSRRKDLFTDLAQKLSYEISEEEARRLHGRLMRGPDIRDGMEWAAGTDPFTVPLGSCSC